MVSQETERAKTLPCRRGISLRWSPHLRQPFGLISTPSARLPKEIRLQPSSSNIIHTEQQVPKVLQSPGSLACVFLVCAGWARAQPGLGSMPSLRFRFWVGELSRRLSKSGLSGADARLAKLCSPMLTRVTPKPPTPVRKWLVGGQNSRRF